MEDPDKRQAIDKAELSFYQDTRKEELFALKEELFFTIDEKSHEADLSEQGRAFLNPDDPDSFVLPDLISEFTEIDLDPDALAPRRKTREKPSASSIATRRPSGFTTSRSCCAPTAFSRRTSHYVVEENKVVIVDEYTGRKMPGRRWSDGLHQAVEAKEGVQIDRETQTLATITIQNYFRLYQKLAGMTGTAETEANEFHDIYKLDVNVIPTNRPVRAEGRQRSHLQDAPRKIQRRHQRDQRSHAQTAAGAGRHGERGSVRVAQPNAEARKNSAQRAEREISHAGSGDRGARRAAGHGHDFDQHGRPRHRH